MEPISSSPPNNVYRRIDGSGGDGGVCRRRRVIGVVGAWVLSSSAVLGELSWGDGGVKIR
ncbi:hypothetical protein Dimus_033416, partial [Dionaea muscipula]